MTLVFLQRHSAARMKMNTSASTNEELKKQRQMTVTILGATIGYVVLSLPLAFHSLFGNFHPRYNYFGPERNVFLVFQEFAYVCHMFSCFTDFFSFLLLSTAYRRTFIRVFGLRRCFDKKQYAESDTVAISVDSSVTTKS
ncbi:hypothetical protein BaRGS_00037798 [Batillaria attramentaria]|uniref:G-protein coupled receptors family 1 profile domain-containing protein n=1 Tax=Batillaria attramentaria TaxID=370345 RepID=A0ABD0J8Z4_9CAEN